MIAEFPLWKSRKFWLMMLDLVISLTLYFGAKYIAPSIYEDIHVIIGLIQPVFIFLITAIAYEDGKAMQAGLVD